MKQYYVALMFAGLALTSCSSGSSGYLSGQKQAYLNATSSPHLTIPAGLHANGLRNEYPIPNRHYTDAEKKVTLAPPPVS